MFGLRIKQIRKRNKLTQSEFADRLSTSSGHISEIENGIKIPGGNFFIAMAREFNISLDWLLTGEGDPYIKGGADRLDADPEVNSLLSMTWTIITSGTGYGESLRANIRSFHDAVQTQRKFEHLEQRITELEKDRGGGGEGGGCSNQTQACAAPKIKRRGRLTGT